jgi:hypothetical protein
MAEAEVKKKKSYEDLMKELEALKASKSEEAEAAEKASRDKAKIGSILKGIAAGGAKASDTLYASYTGQPRQNTSAQLSAAVGDPIKQYLKDKSDKRRADQEDADRKFKLAQYMQQRQRQDSQDERQRAVEDRKFKLDSEKLELVKNKSQGNQGYSEGQKSVDKDYAKHYNTFTQKGAVNAKTSIDRLEALAAEMESDTGVFESGGGRFASTLPDALRSRDAVRRRDQAKNFANTTLKELFGGQLSDAEREAAAKEYYNDALSNSENAKIIRAKIEQLREGYNTEVAKAKYYEQNGGTLRGFSGGISESIAAEPTKRDQGGKLLSGTAVAGDSGEEGPVKMTNGSETRMVPMQHFEAAKKDGYTIVK